MSRGSALLLAPIGVGLGHVFTEFVLHARALSASLLACAVVLVGAAVVSVMVLARRRAHGDAHSMWADLGHQLMVQALLLAFLQGLESVVVTHGVEVVALLHGPTMWVAIGCQVVAALGVRASTAVAADVVRRAVGHQPRLSTRLLCPAMLSIGSTWLPIGLSTPRPIVGRAPPIGDQVLPIRS